MKPFSEALRQPWKNSRSFRVWTVLAVIGLVINLAVTILWQLEIVSFEDAPPANDLQIYLEAGVRFLQLEDLYIAPRADFGLYAYSPTFAMLFGLLTFLPYKLVWVLDALFHFVAYWLLYWRWFVIFREQGLDGAAKQLVRLLPLWIIFTGLLYEIAYMNIYIFMALFATLLLEALLQQQTGKAILWLAILLPIKPQWAFALGIPFLLGQWRFFARVVGGAILAYLCIFLITVLVGSSYVLEQYREYIQFLQTIPQTFGWNTIAEPGHIGYNNSLLQLVNFFTNKAADSVGLTTVIKILLSLPLIVLYWQYRRQTSNNAPSGFILEWTFALYLLAFLWLDVVTELTLAIVLFSYLMGTLSNPALKRLTQLVFLPYALTHIWITFSGIASFLAPLPDLVIDPSLFIPFILIAMLGLYGLLLMQLNNKMRDQKVATAA
ncbi:MAG TPA: glycosyltransferase 87 family protein [Anaerolineales bacterium]|nr:glycosyltransferase 87 family protein [Anaerolineales bacterium]